MSAPKEEQTLVLEYDLFALPTAQHKAGLAGLLLMIESMQRRRMPEVPVVEELTNSHARIAFTQTNMQIMFDDLFNASIVEIAVKQKWQGVQPKRVADTIVTSETGKEKTEKRYVYDVIQPDGAFLRVFYADDRWVGLWRDMLWNTLRARPTTRGVYKERAHEKPSSVVGSGTKGIWSSLHKANKDSARGEIRTEKIASSLFLGAQDVNAEKVTFSGAVTQNLLLHFWTIVSLVYVPRTISLDGKPTTAGYVVAVPEPSHLEYFIEDFKHLVSALESNSAGRTPREALVDLPEEGGLEYLYHLTRHRVQDKHIAFTLAALELYHLEKRGNNVRILAAERLLPNSTVLQHYDGLRNVWRNPFYKALRIQSLLRGEPWYQDANNLFDRLPSEFLVYRQGKTPRRLAFFGRDVNRKFHDIREELLLREGGESVNETRNDDQLALRIYRLIRTYVNQETEQKSGIRYKEFKNSKDEKGRIRYPEKYREAREKVCSSAFLAMRGRRAEDFVEYFTGTICSVPQFLREEDYLDVSRALMEQWETVKTLSMLAFSAHSFISEPSDE